MLGSNRRLWEQIVDDQSQGFAAFFGQFDFVAGQFRHAADADSVVKARDGDFELSSKTVDTGAPSEFVTGRVKE